jgi:Tfp pilus assembly protein PilF
MKLNGEILPTICCIVLLSACSSNQLTADSPLRIMPILAKSSADNPEAMYQTGRYYQGQHRYDLAVDAYQKALEANGNFVEAYNGLGVIYSSQKKYDEAIDAFQSAIRLNPQAAHILNNLGYVYFLQGRYSDSALALEQSVVIEPLNKRTLNNLGLAYAKIGHIPDAEQAFYRAANSSLSLVDADSKKTNSQVQTLPSSQRRSGIASDARQIDEQVLSLPKNMGVIRSMPTSLSELNQQPEDTRRIKLLKVSPYVYELRLNSIAPKSNIINVAHIDNGFLRVEVSNGNGVNGFARRIGKFLKSQGYLPTRLTNQKNYNVLNTQIQYRIGYQSEAKLVQSKFSHAFELVERNDMRPDISIRILLGKDITATKLVGHI